MLKSWQLLLQSSTGSKIQEYYFVMVFLAPPYNPRLLPTSLIVLHMLLALGVNPAASLPLGHRVTS